MKNITRPKGRKVYPQNKVILDCIMSSIPLKHKCLSINLIWVIVSHKYEGCSNMNASSLITFFTYMLQQKVIPVWKELFVAFEMAPNIKKHSLYFSS